MARPKREDEPLELDDRPAPKLSKQVRVKHYKVFTSAGRFIAGQIAMIPEAEADALIAKGHAVAV